MLKTSIKFGTDGWRDKMTSNFTIENVAIVSQGIANYLKTKVNRKIKIAIGYDTRQNSRKFADEVARVLIGNGIKCFYSEDYVPTPVTDYAIVNYDLDGAVMLTASHNPPEYHGIKFIPEYAAPAMPDVTNKITEEVYTILETNNIKKINDLEAAKSSKMLEVVSFLEPYVEHILSLLNLEKLKEKGLKIAFDSLYGTSIPYVPAIFGKLGIDVITLHDNPDPNFGGSSPNPNKKLLTELSNIVISKNLDVGLACDGDADRSGAIDDKGRFVSANEIFAMLFKYLIDKGKKGGVVRTVSTTHLIDKIAEKYDIPLYEVAVGSKYVGEHMRTKDIMMGGEESGGLMFKEHIPEKDGIYTNLKIIEMMLYYDLPLSKIWENITKEFGKLYTRLLNFECEEDLKAKVMRRIKEILPDKILGKNVIKRIELDGFKFMLDDQSWLLIRPSGTEPLLRCSAEATSEKALEEVLNEGVKLLEQAKK
ncbi:MAG: phosphoglucomutase/phosphomannomutase family protein [Candidatus Helarchaeota archaeon]